MRTTALLAAILFFSIPGLPPPLTVSAAISLTNVLEAIAPPYAQGGGSPIRFNFGPSNTLARQIVRGAPVDVFISADAAQMDAAEAGGAIAPGTRVKLLGNTLTLITRRGTTGGVHAITRREFRRVAIGDADAVPAGVYARQWLQAEGIWEQLQPKLIPVASARAVLASVENGSADAGFVYLTDIFASGRVQAAATWLPDRIVYPAAVVRASRNPGEARRFLAFLCGREAAAIFERHRFIPLGCT